MFWRRVVRALIGARVGWATAGPSRAPTTPLSPPGGTLLPRGRVLNVELGVILPETATIDQIGEWMCGVFIEHELELSANNPLKGCLPQTVPDLMKVHGTNSFAVIRVEPNPKKGEGFFIIDIAVVDDNRSPGDERTWKSMTEQMQALKESQKQR